VGILQEYKFFFIIAIIALVSIIALFLDNQKNQEYVNFLYSQQEKLAQIKTLASDYQSIKTVITSDWVTLNWTNNNKLFWLSLDWKAEDIKLLDNFNWILDPADEIIPESWKYAISFATVSNFENWSEWTTDKKLLKNIDENTDWYIEKWLDLLENWYILYSFENIDVANKMIDNYLMDWTIIWNNSVIVPFSWTENNNRISIIAWVPPMICWDMSVWEIAILNDTFNWYNWNKNYWCNLTSISINNNITWNKIPKEIGYLTNLESFILINNNWISWTIPTTIGNMKNLKTIHLTNNDSLTWWIPDTIWNLTNLEYLRITNSSNFNGWIPDTIWNLTKLKQLTLTRNSMSWQIPSSIWNLTNLTLLDLSYNQFNWNLPSTLSALNKVQIFELSWNAMLSWNIFSDIDKMVALTRFSIRWNNFVWSIPNSITNLPNLQNLYIDWNNLSGQIPTDIWNITTLQSLYLQKNNFTWNLPSSIWNITWLRYLYAYDNDFNHYIPESYVNLSNLYFLGLGQNYKLWNLSYNFNKFLWKSEVFEDAISDNWNRMWIKVSGWKIIFTIY